MTAIQTATDFFDRYARALLDRDAAAIAGHYAVPSLIVFPGQSIAVSDVAQTEQFFAGAFAQYDGVTTAEPTATVVASASHSLWVDVTWGYDTAPPERNLYQLVHTDEKWQIAVLTPLEP